MGKTLGEWQRDEAKRLAKEMRELKKSLPWWARAFLAIHGSLPRTTLMFRSPPTSYVKTLIAIEPYIFFMRVVGGFVFNVFNFVGINVQNRSVISALYSERYGYVHPIRIKSYAIKVMWKGKYI